MIKLTLLLLLLTIFTFVEGFPQEIDRFIYSNAACYPRNGHRERYILCVTEGWYYYSLDPEFSLVSCNCSSSNATILNVNYNLGSNSTFRDGTFQMGVCIVENATRAYMYFANTGGGTCSVLTPDSMARATNNNSPAAFSKSLSLTQGGAPVFIFFVFLLLCIRWD
jgi:hypothetical protein